MQFQINLVTGNNGNLFLIDMKMYGIQPKAPYISGKYIILYGVFRKLNVLPGNRLKLPLQ